MVHAFVAPIDLLGDDARVPMNRTRELVEYGALPSQLVDLEREDEPRVLRYLDLRAGLAGSAPPVVIESGADARLHVYDGSRGLANLERWCMRTILRGDGAWIGVLEPGRLRVFQPSVSDRRVEIEEVASTQRGTPILPRFVHESQSGERELAARSYLVQLLGASMRKAEHEHSLGADDAMSLVGRGLFWRFLIDRGLLRGLHPHDVCDQADTWEQCMNSKSRALQTFRWLDETFNGGLLPFAASPRDFPRGVFEGVLANIAYGAEDSGQLRLPTDWREVNFAHIPVGLLSEVYEAFAHDRDPAHARERSIHYTPRRLAEFVVGEALASMTVERPRLLDPAAGAGVFLVAAFRMLAEREWSQKGRRPTRRDLRRILNTQLFAFEIDSRALRLAELALYLTALELDPNPRPLRELRFDALRDRSLLVLPEPDGSLGLVDPEHRGKYDLVVGNPPWTAKTTTTKRSWIENTRGIVRVRLGEERAREFDLPDKNPDLPFVWRAMEWANSTGTIALIMHARWLFGLSRLARARQDILEAVHVTGILNGSALRLTGVWPNVSAPFCLLFARNEPPPNAAAFRFVSPTLDQAPDSRQTRMRIDWLDAEPVLAAEVVARPWTLKAHYKGNRLARRALSVLMRAGEPLGEYLATFQKKLSNGYQPGGAAGRQVPATHLQGLPDLRQHAGVLGAVVDARQLPRFSRETLLRTRPRDIYRAPLLLLRRAIPADLREPRAHRSDEDLAYNAVFSGISLAGVEEGAAVRDYLQILLQSSLFPFFELLVDPQFGMFVDAVYLESVVRFPVPPFQHISRKWRGRAARLAAQLAGSISHDLAQQIDEFTFDLYGLSCADRDAVRDTLAVALPSTDAKRNALRPTTPGDRTAFAETLADSLNRVLAARQLQAHVRLGGPDSLPPWRTLQVDVVRNGKRSSPENLAWRALLEAADSGGASLVHVQPRPDTWHFGILDRYAFWTATRARLLATDIIAERSDV